MPGAVSRLLAEAFAHATDQYDISVWSNTGLTVVPFGIKRVVTAFAAESAVSETFAERMSAAARFARAGIPALRCKHRTNQLVGFYTLVNMVVLFDEVHTYATQHVSVFKFQRPPQRRSVYLRERMNRPKHDVGLTREWPAVYIMR